jgi:hypothetical protein
MKRPKTNRVVVRGRMIGGELIETGAAVAAEPAEVMLRPAARAVHGSL